jgi:hypothetical protein
MRHGFIVGRLSERHPDRIAIGNLVLYLREGTTCTYAIGTMLEVTYTERDDVKMVQTVQSTLRSIPES